MAKFAPLELSPTIEEYSFQCPGCGYAHWVRVKCPRPCWTWNGDVERPTISPSLLVNGHSSDHRCHSFITDGKIQFLDDCWHELKGQTVEIPDRES
jgi:hypothetical protein